MKEKIYVIDTNIILQNIQNLDRISDNKTNKIVIPETVLLELEDKKKLTNELGFYAREFARLLANMKIKEVDYKPGYKVVKLFNDTLNLNIISKDIYEAKIEQVHISESNDKRIIEVAVIAQDYYKGAQTIFLSLDVYARTFALFKGIKTETLHDDKSTVPKFEFVKNIELDSSLFNSLEQSDILNFDEDYKYENFSYCFESIDGNKTYALIINGKINLLTEADFKALNVKPVNLKQKLFMKAILSNMFDLLVIDAKAGSGKTLMSIVSAMRLIDLGLYDKIVYVRNSIESLDKGADIGYLAGNDEKFRIYNMALSDTLEFIAKKQLRKNENRENKESIESKISELTSKYCIETLWPGEARGRTLSSAIVIMDEWQNSSEKTTQLILSRLDESCMAIVIGSNRQIDNLYLNKYNNGLTTLLKQTNEKHDEINMFAIELEKAVRGKFAEFTERIFEKQKNRD
ncbi:phosphate starvation-inducible protein PhoH [Malaciobacter molluscorum LMG 25693]|uniref:Phosphate starvation-inducible protein PhoH n=1 Tax=Malaciobacter molluscorum LMG 25693 TaxID=870501 RepID=A0A2G1DIM0_9BACT|nr:PhoH family protein [Malaciobacter molluscorum]AXX91948.1 putative ribonuclease, YlaK/PhoH family [Malaciobacter molluscorum LMG 25693]PHO18353.1 phosphate starvation-inducible protein PhoH [Malaciobacter molluscorum LMG 25693]RXJ94236.1 phosphate starvation-inducible protein PhoH [Malaciobacter molluscorum]